MYKLEKKESWIFSTGSVNWELVFILFTCFAFEMGCWFLFMQLNYFSSAYEPVICTSS